MTIQPSAEATTLATTSVSPVPSFWSLDWTRSAAAPAASVTSAVAVGALVGSLVGSFVASLVGPAVAETVVAAGFGVAGLLVAAGVAELHALSASMAKQTTTAVLRFQLVLIISSIPNCIWDNPMIYYAAFQ